MINTISFVRVIELMKYRYELKTYTYNNLKPCNLFDR